MIRVPPALLSSRARPGAFAALIGAVAALLLLALAIARATAAPEAGFVVQVVAADAAAQEAAATRVLAALRASPDVAAATRVDPTELARLAGVPDHGGTAALPVLIDVAPRGRPDRPALERLVARYPPASLQPPVTDDRARPLHRLAMLATLVALLIEVGVTVFAARSRFAANEPAIALLRELGADDAAILRVGMDHVALDVAAGSTAALAAALLMLASAGLLGARDLPPLIGTAIGSALLALFVAGGFAVASLRRRR